MEELLNSEQYKLIAPYLPYFAAAGILRLIVVAFMSYSVKQTLLLMKKENRCILPNQVWFMLVPFLNIYWNFVVVRRLTDSLNNEFFDRKVAVEENPSQSKGYWFAGSFLVFNFPLPLFVGFVAWIVSFICLILYWVKINEFKNLLVMPFNRQSEDTHEELWNREDQ